MLYRTNWNHLCNYFNAFDLSILAFLVIPDDAATMITNSIIVGIRRFVPSKSSRVDSKGRMVLWFNKRCRKAILQPRIQLSQRSSNCRPIFTKQVWFQRVIRAIQCYCQFKFLKIQYSTSSNYFNSIDIQVVWLQLFKMQRDILKICSSGLKIYYIRVSVFINLRGQVQNSSNSFKPLCNCTNNHFPSSFQYVFIRKFSPTSGNQIMSSQKRVDLSQELSTDIS